MPGDLLVTGSLSRSRVVSSSTHELHTMIILIEEVNEGRLSLYVHPQFAYPYAPTARYYELTKVAVDGVELMDWLKTNLDYADKLHDLLEEMFKENNYAAGDFTFVLLGFWVEEYVPRYSSFTSAAQTPYSPEDIFSELSLGTEDTEEKRNGLSDWFKCNIL